METLLSKHKWIRLLLGIAILLAGVAVIILAVMGVNAISTIVSVIIAVLCFLYGGILIIATLVKNPRTPFQVEVLVGAIFIGIGITLCIPQVINSLEQCLMYLIGFSLISLGAVALIKAIIIMCYKDPVTNWIFTLIAGALILTGGILLVIFRNKVIQANNIILGSLIVVLGIFEIITYAKIARKK